MDEPTLLPPSDPEYRITHTTACDHTWILEGPPDPQTGLASVRCETCWGGASINLDQTTIKDGKMVPNESL